MKRTLGEKIMMWVIFAVFVLYAVTLVFPFLWTFYNSFKTNLDFYQDVWGFPVNFTLQSYSNAFRLKVGRVNLAGMFANSLLVVSVGTLLGVLSSAVGAYVVAKYRFRGRNFIYTLAVTILLIPTTGSLSATFKLVNDLGLYNNYLGLFLMYSGGLGFNFILLYGYFKNISWAYAEAAMVDGASDAKVFFRVMLPQAVPALIAVGIISAINIWNDFFTVYMFAPNRTTIAVGLNEIVEQMKYEADYPTLFATMLISIVPVVAVFVAFQKTIMENTVAGGLKG